MTARFFVTFSGILILLLGGCANPGSDSGQNENLPFTHWFDLDIGQTTARIQLAVSQEEQTRGLMHRTDLAEDEGMLFAYRRPIRASFWMRNTPLPLDIGFFNSDGALIEVYQMYPYDETSVRSRSEQVRFALEMNQGWFSRNQVRTGASIDHNMLREALRRRGFDPTEFGL